MNFRERLEWIFRMTLILFVLTSVAFLSALMAMRFAIQGREVVMPDVAGKRTVEAQQMLQGRGIGFRVEDRIYSSVPADEIVRQSPPAGMHVKIGQFAHVIVSLGPQKVAIPDLVGKTLRTARIELLRSGMQIGEISGLYIADEPEDTVVQQDPTPGNSGATSPHVDMLVSLGPRPEAYVMPSLDGLPLGEAEARLNAAGLRTSKLVPLAVEGAEHGVVVGQTPSRGARAVAGQSIELQVAE